MSSTPPPKAAAAKRPYDARRRRERAEQERQATQRRVVEAATHLFVEKGYRGTTMADIAAAAGVALQSVYTAATNKAELLHLVVDRAVAGDDDEILVHERAPFHALASEPDPVTQVQMMAAIIAQVQERSAPVQIAYREAAAVDPAIAISVADAHRRRRETFAAVVGAIPAEALRRPVEESTDTTWAIGSTEVFLLMRFVQGWDADRYVTWLGAVLVDALLLPTED
ncbi:MAG TPA: TetR/AcrR family transcriptional regulator [Acidimicrobiales bacterium]|jgi:AcrR family transcriptional regulator|nr:TetR/AcrR family transcriptional regulator [Acidimicrobiales bacterium]